MHHLEKVVSEIGGIGVYGIVSISLFFVVFTGSIVWALRLKKPLLKDMSGLPLEDGSTPDAKGSSHE